MKSPIREIMNAKDWTVSDLANAAGISYTAAYNTVDGNTVNPNPNILDALEKLGYNREEIKAKYERFKEKQKEELLKN